MKDIYGNTLGLKASEQQRAAQHLPPPRVARTKSSAPELARHLTELSRETNRQVGVLINRKGEIEHVVVGNAHKLELPDIGRARAGQVRLRGLRLVHTHLKCEPLTKDDLTDLALLRLDMVAAIGVADDGLPGVLHYAHLLPENGAGEFWRVEHAARRPRRASRTSCDTARGARGGVHRTAAARAVSGREQRHPGGGVPGRQPRRAPRPPRASSRSWRAPPASRCSTACCRCAARPTRATSSAAASSRS